MTLPVVPAGPPTPVCPRCGFYVPADGVVISRGPDAGQVRHRACFEPASTPPAPTLADVLAAGVEPTEADTVRARKRVAGQTDVRAVFALEAGVAGALGEELATTVRNGDPAGVARCVRSLLASAAAGNERVDQILAAPGGAW